MDNDSVHLHEGIAMTIIKKNNINIYQNAKYKTWSINQQQPRPPWHETKRTSPHQYKKQDTDTTQHIQTITQLIDSTRQYHHQKHRKEQSTDRMLQTDGVGLQKTKNHV